MKAKSHIVPDVSNLLDTYQPRSHPKGRERAGEVVRAAYALIAEKGFEGLRTREVSTKVGINSATLHYYFPTKEALIGAVVHHLMQELRQSRVQVAPTAPALERLRAEFADIEVRIRESPEQLLVLTELTLRSWRDPVIAGLLGYLDQGWKGHLTSILNDGIADRTFRPDLNVEETAKAMMSQLRGLIYQGRRDPSENKSLLQHIARQTEHWVKATTKGRGH